MRRRRGAAGASTVNADVPVPRVAMTNGRTDRTANDGTDGTATRNDVSRRATEDGLVIHEGSRRLGRARRGH